MTLTLHSIDYGWLMGDPVVSDPGTALAGLTPSAYALQLA